MSFRRILVPTDFSRHADQAAELALSIAERDGAELVLLHVSPMPDYAMLAVEPMYLPPKLWDRLWDRECSQIQLKLDALAQQLHAVGKGTAEITKIYRRGNPVTQILEVAEGLDIDLIALGSQGADGTLRYLFGGVAGKVAREAPCPVLVAPPEAPRRAPRNALVAVDYSKFSAPAAEVALAAVGDAGDITCLHVWRHPPVRGWEPFSEFAEAVEQVRHGAVAHLDEFAADLAMRDRNVGKRIEVGSPAQGILDSAREIRADLIVLGAHSRHGVERIIGTVADRVLRQAEVAVLMVPERALEDRKVRSVA